MVFTYIDTQTIRFWDHTQNFDEHERRFDRYRVHKNPSGVVAPAEEV